MAKSHTSSSLGKFFQNLKERKKQPSSTAVGNLFASVAAKQKKESIGASSSSQPSDVPAGKDLTPFLVQECMAKHLLAQGEAKKIVKRRYNNKKRKMLADSRVPSRGGVQRSRQDQERVRTLTEKRCCNCSLERCFSQFAPILCQLMQLLVLWSDQPKGVRDEVLSLCVRSMTVVLGLKVSLTCFRVLFQVGKAQAEKMSRGAPIIDLRMRGQPQLQKSKMQEGKARQYLISVYCRLGSLGSILSVLNVLFCLWLLCYLTTPGVAMSSYQFLLEIS